MYDQKKNALVCDVCDHEERRELDRGDAFMNQLEVLLRKSLEAEGWTRVRISEKLYDLCSSCSVK